MKGRANGQYLGGFFCLLPGSVACCKAQASLARSRHLHTALFPTPIPFFGLHPLQPLPYGPQGQKALAGVGGRQRKKVSGKVVAQIGPRPKFPPLNRRRALRAFRLTSALAHMLRCVGWRWAQYAQLIGITNGCSHAPAFFASLEAVPDAWHGGLTGRARLLKPKASGWEDS